MKIAVTVAAYTLLTLAHAQAASSFDNSSGGSGQAYPVKPIRLVVPFSPGGPVDIVGRIVAQKLTAALAQQVIVDNRAGGGGNIAVEIVAKSVPDGYTLLMGANGTNAINPSLYPKLAVDAVKDLAPVGMVASSPMILVTHPAVPASTVKDLVALAKARPGAINFASSGSGSTAHLAAELFKSMAQINIVHIAYKGTGAALTALLGGEIQMMFAGPGPVEPHVKAGRVKTLAVTSRAPSALAPGLPTLSESGLPGYEATAMIALLAPAGTPASTATRLNQEVVKVLDLPEVKEKLLAAGTEVAGSSPRQLLQVMKSEMSKWEKIIRQAGIKE